MWMIGWLVFLLLGTGWVGATPVGKEVVQGVTISTHGGGRDWGEDGIVPTMVEIQEVGANRVLIHPYARIGSDGSVRFRDFDVANPPEYLVRPIREAHARGLSICIKPHLAYWRSPFAYRTEIVFEDPEHQARFWREYRVWILKLAEVCRAADGFVVGTELDRMLDEEEWRSLIAEVRKVTNVPLTYAANWSDYQRVTFWDALDVIGIQAYFPLTDQVDPEEAEVRVGWARRMEELRGYAAGWNREILFTELGYNRSYRAAVEPWDYQVDGEDASRVQEMCLRVALEEISKEPRVVGAFLWKWFPHPRSVGRNFQLATPGLKRVIARVWSGKVE